METASKTRRLSNVSTASNVSASSVGTEFGQTDLQIWGDKPLPVDYLGNISTLDDGRWSNSGVKKHHHKHNLKHRYELLETLGKGTYGKVKKAIERQSGRVVAIKSIRKEKIKDDQDMVHIRREIEIMSSLKHPHIISIHEVFENKDKIVIVMEYASKGELYDYISERRRLSERETRHFFRQIVSAVHHCHKNGIVHRDLKLENVLLDENCNIKIADFGLSNLYHKDKLLQTFCGSPLYASPEIVNGRPYHGPEVDSWALGVLLYSLIYGTMPFDGDDHNKLIRQITNGEYKEPAQTSDARGLIRWMLMVNPIRRATVEDVANHWWVNWGWKTSVCDCDHQMDASGAVTSPTLARFIDWQNSSPDSPRAAPSKPPRSEPAGTLAHAARQRHRKSSKENEGAGRPNHPAGGEDKEKDKPGLKRPKGILKTRVTDQRSHSVGEIELSRTLHFQGVQGGEPPSSPEGDDEEREEDQDRLGVSPAKIVPTLPVKGILKTHRHRESGYYSSPEHGESSDLPGDGSSVAPPCSSPMKRPVGRKGILKRNGKYGNSPSFPSGLSSLGYQGETQTDLGLSRSQSRPSSMVCDEMGLSSGGPPFIRVDWPPSSLQPNVRACMSAEDLLQLAGFRLGLQTAALGLHGGKVGTRGTPGSPGDNGSFSLLGDMDNMTQVYQHALDISNKQTYGELG
ncbi:hypothetical protein DPEC_G00116870 [Dallia pectoralis]|uniref:Uncharacterized protein n=1 Tax=Dallia pectoralis TaxID=75939 RepID=A0ACC2GUN9_DALPE|nr:hypothetical protein DPEC_G00116870 [Dallia pectoralis]